MKYNSCDLRATGLSPQRNRRSIRLRGYDYSQAGAYFMTICTQNRECLFGEIVDGEMRLNAAGDMVQKVWDEIPAYYPGIDIDEFVVMPNHIHGIIVIVGAAPRGRPPQGQSHDGQSRDGQAWNGHPQDGHPQDGHPQDGHPQRGQARGGQARGGQARGGQARGGQARGPAPTGLSLPDVVHRYKTMTTKRYVDGVKQSGWQPFPGRLWQRNYWEHIVRHESDMDRIREYILNNPAQWELDKLYVGAAPCGRPVPGQPRDGQRDAQAGTGRHGGLPLRNSLDNHDLQRITCLCAYLKSGDK